MVHPVHVRALVAGCVKSLPKSCASVVLLLVERGERRGDVLGAALPPVGEGGEGLEQRGRLPLQNGGPTGLGWKMLCR